MKSFVSKNFLNDLFVSYGYFSILVRTVFYCEVACFLLIMNKLESDKSSEPENFEFNVFNKICSSMEKIYGLMRFFVCLLSLTNQSFRRSRLKSNQAFCLFFVIQPNKYEIKYNFTLSTTNVISVFFPKNHCGANECHSVIVSTFL